MHEHFSKVSFSLTTDHNSRELVNRRSLCSQYKAIFITFLAILSHFLFFTKKANYSFFICCFLPSDAIFYIAVVFMLHVQLFAVSSESDIAASIPLRALSVPGEWCKQFFWDPRSVICQAQDQQCYVSWNMENFTGNTSRLADSAPIRGRVINVIRSHQMIWWAPDIINNFRVTVRELGLRGSCYIWEGMIF